MSNTSTPYDDAQRTLSVDCPSLLIPLVNEAFQTNYPLDADVKLYNNEFFITTGNDQKRITDSNFSLNGEKTTRYHFECQSTEDGSLTLRLFEYGAQIALTMAEYSKEESTFIFPHAAVLYLRTENTTPSSIWMRIVTPGGKITEFTRQSLKAMIDKVAMFRATHYEKVKEEVKEIMGGKILDYEAKDIRNKGIQMGITIGKQEGISIGKEVGKQEGEEIALKLIQLLMKQGRTEDIALASTDPEARRKLYEEFHLI